MGTIPRPGVLFIHTVHRELLTGEQFILLSEGSDSGTPLLLSEGSDLGTPMILGEIYG